jgi:hypothetical protein
MRREEIEARCSDGGDQARVVLKKASFLCVLLVSAASRLAIGAVTASEAEAWKEDLHFLANEMVKVHPNLFHAVSREQFNAAVAELDERIPLLTRDDVILGMARLVALIGMPRPSSWENQRRRAPTSTAMRRRSSFRIAG